MNNDGINTNLSLRDHKRVAELKAQIDELNQAGLHDLAENLLSEIEKITESSHSDHVNEVRGLVSKGRHFTPEENSIIDEWINEITGKLPNLNEEEISLIEDILYKQVKERKYSGMLREISEKLCVKEIYQLLDVDFLRDYARYVGRAGYNYEDGKPDGNRLNKIIETLKEKIPNDSKFWFYFAPNLYKHNVNSRNYGYTVQQIVGDIIPSKTIINYLDEKSKDGGVLDEDDINCDIISFYLNEGYVRDIENFKISHTTLIDLYTLLPYYYRAHSKCRGNWGFEQILDKEALKSEVQFLFLSSSTLYLYFKVFGEKIMDLIDDTYKTPKYINDYIKMGEGHKTPDGISGYEIPNGLSLATSYLNSVESGKINESGSGEKSIESEKYNGAILDCIGYDDSDLCHRDIFAVWQHPELLKVIDIDTLPPEFFPLWFYLYLKHKTDIDTSKLIEKVFQSRDFLEFASDDRINRKGGQDYYEVRDIRRSRKYDYKLYVQNGYLNSIHEYGETDTPSRFTEFMQDVYATGKYLYGLYKLCFLNKENNSSLFVDCFDRCTDEDKDILLRKIINANFINSIEGCKEFLYAISHHGRWNHKTRHTPLAMMIYYVITGEIPTTRDYLEYFDGDIKIPATIYRKLYVSAMAQGKEIPSNWKPVKDPYVDVKSLEHLKALYQELQAAKKREYEEEQARQAKLRRIWEEQQERERELNETKEYVLAHWDEGEVILDYRKQTPYDEKGQKFILVVDPAKKKLIFISEDLTFHSNIKQKYCPDGLCLGGGRIYIDDDGVYHLYDRSKSYGYVAGEYKKAMENLLKKQFPDKKIEIS